MKSKLKITTVTNIDMYMIYMQQHHERSPRPITVENTKGTDLRQQRVCQINIRIDLVQFVTYSYAEEKFIKLLSPKFRINSRGGNKCNKWVHPIKHGKQTKTFKTFFVGNIRNLL